MGSKAGLNWLGDAGCNLYFILRISNGKPFLNHPLSSGLTVIQPAANQYLGFLSAQTYNELNSAHVSGLQATIVVSFKINPMFQVHPLQKIASV